MTELKTTVRIDKIQKIETKTKNKEKLVNRLVGKDADGYTKVIIETPQALKGFKLDEVLDISLFTSQTSLKEFNKEEEKEE